MKKIFFFAMNSAATEIISNNCADEVQVDYYEPSMFFLCVPDETDEIEAQEEIAFMFFRFGLFFEKDYIFV